MGTDFDQSVRARWSGQAGAYERGFAKLCAYTADLLLDRAGVGVGDRVLDAGTGPGTVAASACARGATVTAVDPEPSMLDAARRSAPQADIRRGGLPGLPFPDGAFDAAVANFVVHFVGDPAAAVADLRRVVRPGGRVAVTVWPHPAPPLQALWDDAFHAACGEHLPAGPAVPDGKDFPRTEAGFTGLLAAAGLTDVRCERLSWHHRIDPDEWWSGTAAGVGRLGLLMRGQPAEVVARIRREYDRLSAVYRTDDGQLALPTAALLAVGRAPTSG